MTEVQVYEGDGVDHDVYPWINLTHYAVSSVLETAGDATPVRIYRFHLKVIDETRRADLFNHVSQLAGRKANVLFNREEQVENILLTVGDAERAMGPWVIVTALLRPD